MFGKEIAKDIRLALEETDCNMLAWKKWQKQCEKMIKQMPDVCEKYETARELTIEVQGTVQQIEQLLIACREGENDVSREVRECIKGLKKYQNSFEHLFLVNKDDKDFHSTYECILKLGTKSLEDEKDAIILQSEVENLLYLLKENLEREKPDLQALTYYEIEGDMQKITECSPKVRLSMITDCFEKEFVSLFLELVTEGIIRADARKTTLENSLDRNDRRAVECLQVFWDTQKRADTPEQRARELLWEILELL